MENKWYLVVIAASKPPNRHPSLPPKDMMQALGVVQFCHILTKTFQMKRIKEYIKIPDTAKDLPQISLVIPFEPKMNQQLSLTNLLTLSADDVERKLVSKYPKEMVVPVIKKLRHLIADIQCGHDKMSLCILVSPLTEKVFYFTPTKELSNHFPNS